MSLMPSVTVGTNSYVTVAEVDAYIADERSPNFFPATTEWDAMTDGQKAALLVLAASHIEQVKFAGSKYETDQAMEWPRMATAKSGFRDAYEEADDYEVTVDDVWQIKVAQCEEAIACAHRQNWNIERVVSHEQTKGIKTTKNPDVILQSNVAYNLLLESGWLCIGSYEMED